MNSSFQMENRGKFLIYGSKHRFSTHNLCFEQKKKKKKKKTPLQPPLLPLLNGD